MSDDEPGGESACWLDRVCPECGAFVETADGHCERCVENRS